MNTLRPARANVIARTAAAMLGLGMLAGCTSGGSGAAPPPAAGSGVRATSAAGSGVRATSAAGSGVRATPATGSAASALSAPRLLSAALAAVRTGGSVHVDITSVARDGTVAFSDDATGSGGRQVITFDGTGHATILLIRGVDYVRADAQALNGFFQVPLAQAEQAAGQWISLRPGEKLGASTYDDVTAGITLSSVATELQVGGPLSKTGPATVAGQQVVGVQAPLPASDGLPGAKLVLYVTDNTALRPVRWELVGGGSTRNEFSFSQWGEKLTLTPPANAVPASSITSGSTTV